MKTPFLIFVLLIMISPDPSCLEKLQSGYKFLKQISVRPGEYGYFETSYVFAKGCSYNLITCPSSEFTRFEVYNSQRQKVIELSDKTSVSIPIQYNCQATGVYYLRLYQGSGELVLGFKRT